MIVQEVFLFLDMVDTQNLICQKMAVPLMAILTVGQKVAPYHAYCTILTCLGWFVFVFKGVG